MDNKNNVLDQLEIPESLQPENIEAMLNEHKKNKKKEWSAKKTVACVASFGLLALVGAGSAIALGSKDSPKGSISEFVNNRTEDKGGILHLASSQAELNKMFEDRTSLFDYIISGQSKEDSLPNEVAEAEATNGACNTIEHSSTNLMVEGIDEGDIVKTDGKYFYILKNSNTLVIASAKDGQLEQIASYDLKQDFENRYVYSRELYLLEDSHKLIAIVNADKTYVETFDITDPATPTLTDTYSQSGQYDTSRLANGYLYVFSNMGYSEISEKCGVPDIDGSSMGYNSVYLTDCNTQHEYVMAALKVNEDGSMECTDATSLCLPYSSVYMGNDNLYIYYVDYSYQYTATDVLLFVMGESVEETDMFSSICQFAYADGKFELKNTTRFEGYIPDKFAISERDGYLFLLTKSGYDISAENRFDIFDSEFQTVGSIRDIAPNENIYAARYIDDKVYFITYEAVDPLFVVDISNPADPKLLGNVEISGFSEYLHPFGDNLLIGIGYETVPNGYGGLRTDSVKLVMFDITDPMNPTVADAIEVPDTCYSDSMYDYKAFFASSDKNLIGFTAYVAEADDYWGCKYFLYQWIDGKFQATPVSGTATAEYDTRGNFIGDYFYLSNSEGIASWDMTDNFSQIDNISFE